MLRSSRLIDRHSSRQDDSSEEYGSPGSPATHAASSSRHRKQKVTNSRSADDVETTDDLWEPFTLHGFDARSLDFADSNILRTPDGNFFKYDKVPIASNNTFSLAPLSLGPTSPQRSQPPGTKAESRAAGKQPARQGSPSSRRAHEHDSNRRRNSSNKRPEHVGPRRNHVSPPPDAERVDSKVHIAPLHGTWNESSHLQRRSNGEYDPDIASAARLRNETRVNSSTLQEGPRTAYDGPDTRFESQDGSFRQVHSADIRQTGHKYYQTAGRAQYVDRQARREAVQSELLRPSQGTQATLTYPFPNEINTSLEHYSKSSRAQRRETTGNTMNTAGINLAQVAPTTMVLPSEYFTHSRHNGSRTVDSNQSSPTSPDRRERRFAEDSASNAPIYAGSDVATTDSDRSNNEYVLPGEVLVFEGDVRRSTSFRSPFQNALLKIFRHTITQDLRFYSRTSSFSGVDTESFKMQHHDTELVPTYAYDISKPNVAYLREASRARSGISQSYPIYEFPLLKDLIMFQGKLLGEEVHLDISSLRFVTLIERSGAQRRIDFARLQIWHEENQGTRRSDAGSIMTAGTALSGPMKERTRPSSSRLVVFLGRSEEYLSIFVTDDITLKGRGSTRLCLQATKYTGKDYFKSRTGIKCHHAQRTTSAAGVPLAMEGLDPDDEESFDQLKSLELEFENDPSLIHFWQTWDYLVRLRRKQRLQIREIQDDMSRRLYYGSIATKIL